MKDPLMALVDAASERFDQSVKGASEEQKKKSYGVMRPSSLSITVPAATAATLTSSSITFLQKLRTTLDDDTIDVLQWMPNGKSFHIVHPKQFKKQLKDLFQLQTMSSFLRKLNQLDFTRIHDRVTMDLDIFQHPKFTRESGVDIAPAVVTSTTSATPSPPSPKVVSQTASPSIIPPTAPSSSPRKIITAVLPSFPTTNGGSACSSTTSSLSLSPRLDGMVYCPQAAATTTSVGSLLPEAPSLTSMKAAGAANSNNNCNNARSTATTDATINSLLLKELLRERETLLHGMDRLSQTVVSLLQTQQQLPPPPTTTTTSSSAYPHLLHQYGSYRHHHHHHYSSYGSRATTPPSAPPPHQHHQATRYY
jgi:hypothetical protein